MLSKYNPYIVFTVIIISIIGLITLASTQLSISKELVFGEILTKQMIFILAGAVLFFLFSKFDYTYLKIDKVVIAIYVVTIVLLILTIGFGESVKGAKRWLDLGFFQLQPSEIAKLTVIFTTSYIFTLKGKYNEWLLLLISFVAVLPISILIYLQPHGSMAFIMIFLWFITSFISMPNQLRNILMMVIFSLVSIPLFLLLLLKNSIWIIPVIIGVVIYIFAFNGKESWKLPLTITFILAILFAPVLNFSWNNLLQEYQKNRILVVGNEDINNENAFNVNQAKIAIGSGRVWGKGFGNGTQSKLNFLPEHQTDFIFASFAEEFGLVGSVILILLYFTLLFSLFYPTILGHTEQFGSILIVTIGIKLLLEIFINLGTNLGITPATGIPLPLMSAGGTITIMTFISLGIIQSILINNQETALKSSFIDN